MTVTSQFRPSRALRLSLGVLLVLAGIRCSRPLNVPADSAVGHADPHQAPFHEDGIKDNHPEEDVAGAGPAGSNLPFRDRESLPAGTLISVRLKDAISVGEGETSNTFDALVVEPVIIEGRTLIPTGATVTGVVESARTSKVKVNRGYLRLSLASFRVGGLDVPLQTASLFVRQFPVTVASSSEIYLEKGRWLIFRLTKPADLANQGAQATH